MSLTVSLMLPPTWWAIAGYLSLWSVFWAFKLLTKKDGMGYGDFKLLVALGAWLGLAWLGWQLLPFLASQATRQQRLDAADDVIINFGDSPALTLQIAQLHRQYLKMDHDL